MALLGIDIGTSGVKASVFEKDGTLLGTGRFEYPTLHPAPGHAELDSTEVYARSCDAIRAAVAEANSAGAIEAMCFTSMAEAMVPVSADRRILGHSILGTDVRGEQYVPRLAEAFTPTELYSINPNILGPSYSMPKLCWLQEHQPDLYGKTDFFLAWADCLPFLLGCEAITNYTHANRTLLFDIRREGWSEPLIEAAGLDGDKLAPTVRPGHVLGPISAEAARDLGIAGRPPVVVGAHDQCCNAVGAGAINAGDAVCGIGTVECITPVYASIPRSGPMLEAGLNVEHHAIAGRYVSFIYNQAGRLVRWLRDLVGHGENARFSDLMDELPEEASGLLALPYFEPTGAPKFAHGGAGSILGLSPEVDRGRLLKGILEAESYYFVEPLEQLTSLGFETNKIVATGGGSQSDNWLQLKADVFGIPITRLHTSEAGTLGAAIVAGVAVGTYSTVEEAIDSTVRFSDRFEARPDRHKSYREWHGLYRRLYSTLAPLLDDIRRLRSHPTAE